MKKLFNHIFFLALLFAAPSCTKDYLERKPLDILSDEQVWNDPALIEAYIVNLYDRSKMSGLFSEFDWSQTYYDAPMRLAIITDEGKGGWDWLGEVGVFNKGLLNRDGGLLDYWDYKFIRSCNEFLQLIQTGKVTEEEKVVTSAEVRFLRAYAYYEMVIRYGGVPLITEPQNADDFDALFVPRNTEKEIFDFILAECDQVSAILPEEYDATKKGRATKFAALALKSRAMLFAASEAKYGTEELNGLVGMPAGEANEYWQQSLNASKAIIDAGKFSLFNRYPDDKAKNYQRLFLEEDNEETILAKKFVSTIKGHNFDYYTELQSFAAGWANGIAVTVEMVDSYEMTDGSNPVIDWANMTGFQSEILKNKDPRFHASVFYNGSPWKTDSAVLYWGIDVDTDGDGVKERLSSTTGEYNGMPHIGKDANGGETTKTGFSIKKFRDDSKRHQENESGQDWIVYRYGEVLLNYAEAAFELGMIGEALDALNQIRTRAGLPAAGSVTIEQIRQERKVELAFETLRWWDLKRWRQSEAALNMTFKSVRGYFDWAQQNYHFEVGTADGYQRVFKPNHYYQPISETVTSNNPSLLENPGY